jgi:hypothetical protein
VAVHPVGVLASTPLRVSGRMQPMPSTPSLAGRTMFISGASRGIGLAIALRVAADGGNVCLMAKTDKPDPRLEGSTA